MNIHNFFVLIEKVDISLRVEEGDITATLRRDGARVSGCFSLRWR
jgi:hypothetical protein